MSKKLTEQTIEEMILEMLKPEIINEAPNKAFQIQWLSYHVGAAVNYFKYGTKPSDIPDINYGPYIEETAQANSLKNIPKWVEHFAKHNYDICKLVITEMLQYLKYDMKVQNRKKGTQTIDLTTVNWTDVFKNLKIGNIIPSDKILDRFFSSKVANQKPSEIIADQFKKIHPNKNGFNINKIYEYEGIKGEPLIVPNLERLKNKPNVSTPSQQLRAEPNLDLITKAIGDKQTKDGKNLKDLFQKIVFDNDITQDNIASLAESFLKENPNVLEPMDFDKFFDKALDPKDDDYDATQGKTIEARLKNFYTKIPDEFVELKNITASVIKQFRQTDNMRTSKGTLSGYNITSKSASGAKIDAQVVDAFSKAFSGTTFKERMTQFNNYANEISKFIGGEKRTKESMDKEFAKFITLDLMQQILYSFEASSAGWVYESFLAFMAFGNAIGASYGAGDFTINQAGKQIEGSAKLLQDGRSEQNVENVKVGTPIRYVFGVKESIDTVTDPFQKRRAGEMVPTKQTMKTGKLTVYMLDVVKNNNGKFYAVPVGQTVNPKSDKRLESYTKGAGTRIIIKVEDVSKVAPIGVIDLVFLQKEEFEEYSGRIISDISQDLEKAMLYMSELKSNVDDYVLNSEDVKERTYYSKEAMKNHSQLKLALQGSEDKEGLFKESKLKTIDDLIAETMRGIKRRRK